MALLVQARGVSPTPVYLHEDALGSTYLATDAAGSVVEHYTYTAYGEVSAFDNAGVAVATPTTRFLYTGRERIGEVGLNDHRNRFYLPSLGRWPSRDPIGEQGGINLYTYVLNKPLSYIDANGRWALLPWVGGVVGGWALGEEINTFACWGNNTRTERGSRRCVKYFRSRGGVTQSFWGEYDATSNYACSARSRGGPGVWQLTSTERHSSCNVTNGPTCPGEWTGREEYY